MKYLLNIDARFNRMTKKIDRIVAQFNKSLQETQAKESLNNMFNDGTKINYYTWIYEYSFLPVRKCFTTQESITPGTKAYKGTKQLPGPGHTFKFTCLPNEIWLSKEEFTLYKLKGQI